MTLVISKIKLFIMNYGKCKIFQTEVISRVYHPQTNRGVKAIHKSVRKYLINEFKKKKNKFNIEISLEEFIIYHNNNIHGSTKR